MDDRLKEILGIFTRTRALLEGHFVLRSGLHSGHYFQCAQVCQHMDAVERLGELLLAKVTDARVEFDTVLAPAMGGLVIGQEVARRAKARFIFAEKENNVLVLRRGFTLQPGERVLIVEDVNPVAFPWPWRCWSIAVQEPHVSTCRRFPCSS
jgi:orotate phosphoribosyltransferase